MYLRSQLDQFTYIEKLYIYYTRVTVTFLAQAASILRLFVEIAIEMSAFWSQRTGATAAVGDGPASADAQDKSVCDRDYNSVMAKFTEGTSVTDCV